MAEINYNFGGPQQTKGGGIMDVKLSPSQMRFPTARRPASREKIEPSMLEKLAPILPLVTEGVLGLFSKDDSKSDEEYLAGLTSGFVEEPENLGDIKRNQKVQAQIDTYNQYGTPEDENTFGMDEIVNLLVASQMGKGAVDYSKSYMNIRKAKGADQRSKTATRGAFLSKQLEQDAYQLKTFFDMDAATKGNQKLVDGIFNPTDGKRYGYSDNGLVPLDKNWIEFRAGQGGTDITKFQGNQQTALKKLTDEFKVKDMATTQVIRVANDLIIDNLNPAIAGETMSPASIVAGLVNVGNNAWQEYNSIKRVLNVDRNGNQRTGSSYFSTSKNGGSKTRQGTGFVAKDLSDILERYANDPTSVTEEEMDKSLNSLGDTYKETTGKDIKQLIGSVGFNTVATKASFLQLAYMFASANGQTGRTLSDKDLAYHLDIVGFGSSSDPKVLKTNLLRAVDGLISGNDADVMIRLNQGDMRQYDPGKNENAVKLIDFYYDPITTTEGLEKWSDYTNYTFTPFDTRYGVKSKILSRRNTSLIDEWRSHESEFPEMYQRNTFKAPIVNDGVEQTTVPVPTTSTSRIEEILGSG